MSGVKRCTKCNHVKTLDSFGIFRGDKRKSWCRECDKASIYEARAKPGGRDRSRAYSRARSRAFRTLADRHPQEFEALLTNERVAEGLSPIPWDRTA